MPTTASGARRCASAPAGSSTAATCVLSRPVAGTCEGKVALVTGASRGLGKSIAKRLAAEGAVVAITARTLDPDPKYAGSLRLTLEEITAAGGQAVPIQADLSQADERERLWAEALRTVGAPDILVNNAAVTFLRPLDGFPDK